MSLSPHTNSVLRGGTRKNRGTGGELTYPLSLPAGGSQDGLAGGRRLGPGRRAGAQQRADPDAAAPGRGARRQDRRPRQQLAAHDPAVAARRPAGAARGRLGQAEHRRPHPAGDRTCRSAGPTRASSSRRRSAPCRRRPGSAPATPTTRGSSAPTPSTPPSPRSRSASSRRSRDTCARCETSPTSSTTVRASSPTRWCPTARSGSDTTRGRPNPDGTIALRLQHRRDGQVPEHRRAALAVDRRQRLPRRDVRLLGAQPALRRAAASTPTTTAGPRDSATSSAPAWGRRSSTTPSTSSAVCTTSPTWPRSKHDGATVRVGDEPGRRRCASASTAPGGTRQRRSTPTRSTTRATSSPSRSTGSARRRWRPSCTSTARRCPAWRRSTTATPRWPAGRTTATAARRRSTRACSTPAAAAAPNGQGEKVIFGLTTSIQSIGEGNYGRLGAGPAAALHPRARRADVRRARDRRHAGRAAGSDAGDLPVAGPGREHRPLLDLPLDVHAGLGQLRHRVGRSCTSGWASGRTSARGRLDVRAAGAAGPDLVQGKDIRLGGGSADVRATHNGNRYRTEIAPSAGSAPARWSSATPCPPALRPRPSSWTDARSQLPVAETNRGAEVTVSTHTEGTTR